MYREYKAKRIISGKLPHGADVTESLKSICNKEGITLGNIHILGAVKKASLGFYNQTKKEYEMLIFNEPLEIVSSLGNVSLKDGETFVHIHVTLSNSRGEALGGHLMSPTEIFACEFSIVETLGAPLVRKLDEVTGLYLWDI